MNALRSSASRLAGSTSRSAPAGAPLNEDRDDLTTAGRKVFHRSTSIYAHAPARERDVRKQEQTLPTAFADSHPRFIPASAEVNNPAPYSPQPRAATVSFAPEGMALSASVIDRRGSSQESQHEGRLRMRTELETERHDVRGGLKRRAACGNLAAMEQYHSAVHANTVPRHPARRCEGRLRQERNVRRAANAQV